MIASLLIAHRGGIACPLFLPELVSGRGTTRRVVEGKPRRRFNQNEHHNRTDVIQYIARRYAHCANPDLREICIANGVARGLIPARMGFAIDFDRQPGIAAEEVEDVRTAGVLTPEFETVRACPKNTPKDHFRQAHQMTQLAGARNSATLRLGCDILEHPLSPPSVLRTVTSPRQAR